MSALGYFRLGYHNLVLVATVTAGSAETDYPAVNVADESLHTFWKPNGTGWQYLKFDFGAAKAIDFLGVLGHTLFSSGVTQTQLKYGTADNGTDFENVLFDWDVDGETSDYHKFFATDTAVTKQYWLLTSNVVSTHPAIAVAFLGTLAKLETHLSWPDERTEDYGVDVTETAGGQSHATQYATAKRELIALHSEGVSDTERGLFQTIETYHKNGLHPLCLMDVDTEAASGLCKYGRIAGPLVHRRVFVDANQIDTRLFKEEL